MSRGPPATSVPEITTLGSCKDSGWGACGKAHPILQSRWVHIPVLPCNACGGQVASFLSLPSFPCPVTVVTPQPGMAQSTGPGLPCLDAVPVQAVEGGQVQEEAASIGPELDKTENLPGLLTFSEGQ